MIKKKNSSVQSDSEIDRLRDFAHEIRTPMNAMMGYSQLIQSKLGNEKKGLKIKEYARTIEKSTIRLMRICERVLDDALEAERSVCPENVNMSEMAKEIVETFGELAAKKGIALKHEFPDDFPELYTDPVLVGQVLSNLVSNAIKFTPRGGSIRVTGELDTDRNALVFVISDTGNGVPAELLLKIRSGDKISTAGKTGQKGWGRGLAISLEICNLLGADLNFAQSKNGGTVVAFSLPIMPDHQINSA